MSRTPNKEFLVLRYALIAEPQGSLIAKSLPTPKGAAILPAISGESDFRLHGVRYGFIGFHNVEPPPKVSSHGTRFFLGKIAKLKQSPRGKRVPGDIVRMVEDDWVPVLVLVDIETQTIFLQKDFRFGPPDQLFHALEAGLRPAVHRMYNHQVFVKPRTTTRAFWSIVKNYHYLYRVDFRVVSPNFFGTNQSARDAVAAVQSLFNQDEASITLRNDSGALKLPEEPVSDYLEYIAEGEGTWSVTTEGERGSGKKTHRSIDSMITVSLPVSQPEGILEPVEDATVTAEISEARLVAAAISAMRTFGES